MEDKQYCIKTELLAKLAKAITTPARISIMRFLAKNSGMLCLLL